MQEGSQHQPSAGTIPADIEPPANRASARVIDLLVDALIETLKSIDASILFAVVSAAFILIHGLQDDMKRELNAQIRQKQIHAQGSDGIASTFGTSPGPVKTVKIPGLETEAALYDAVLIALVLFWVFTVRAAFRARQLVLVMKRLSEADPTTLAAALLFPAFATGSALMKAWICIVLGVLGSLSALAVYAPLFALTKEPLSQMVVLLVLVAAPVVILYWQLRRIPVLPS